MKKWLHCALLVAVVSGLSACAWFGGDKKMSLLTEYPPTAKVATVWQKNIGKQSSLGFAPLIQDGVVYAASANGQVVAIEIAANRELWRIAFKERLSAGVGGGASGVYVGMRKGEVVALDLTGKERWRSPVSSEILAAPQSAQGVVIVRTVDGRIVGLDEADGKRRWLQQRSNPALVLRNLAPIVAANGLAYVGMPGGRLLALNVADGTIAWEVAVAQPRGVTELERIADVAAAPLLDEDQICAVAYQGRLACFDQQKGGLEWYREVSSASGLSKDGGAIYTTDDKGTALSFAKVSGTNRWKQEKLQGRKLSGPAVAGKYVVVGDVEGYLHVLESETGQLAARIATDKSPIVSAPVAIDNGVIVQTQKGNLYAISIQ